MRSRSYSSGSRAASLWPAGRCGLEQQVLVAVAELESRTSKPCARNSRPASRARSTSSARSRRPRTRRPRGRARRRAARSSTAVPGSSPMAAPHRGRRTPRPVRCAPACAGTRRASRVQVRVLLRVEVADPARCARPPRRSRARGVTPGRCRCRGIPDLRRPASQEFALAAADLERALRVVALDVVGARSRARTSGTCGEKACVSS